MTTKPVTRRWTNHILKLVDEGCLDARQMLSAALSYMSEADVADLAHDCELDTDDEESEEGEA